MRPTSEWQQYINDKVAIAILCACLDRTSKTWEDFYKTQATKYTMAAAMHPAEALNKPDAMLRKYPNRLACFYIVLPWHVSPACTYEHQGVAASLRTSW